MQFLINVLLLFVKSNITENCGLACLRATVVKFRKVLRNLIPLGTFNTFRKCGATTYSENQSHTATLALLSPPQISSPCCWFIESVERNRGPSASRYSRVRRRQIYFSECVIPILYIRTCKLYTPTKDLCNRMGYALVL